MKPEELKRLQAAKKQREKEKKDAETNARRHAANVRVRQRAQVHIQGMTTKIANEDVSVLDAGIGNVDRHYYLASMLMCLYIPQTLPYLKGSDQFGRFGKILKLFFSRRAAIPGPGAPSTPIPSTSSIGPYVPVNVYINYSSAAEANACIAAIDGSVTPDGHKLKATWGTTRYCPAYLRGVRCTNENCMQAHEPGEELESGTHPGGNGMERPFHPQNPSYSYNNHAGHNSTNRGERQPEGFRETRDEMVNLKHAYKEQVAKEPALPPSASWASKPSASGSSQLQSTSMASRPSSSDLRRTSSSSSPSQNHRPAPSNATPSTSTSTSIPSHTHSSSISSRLPRAQNHPLPARPLSRTSSVDLSRTRSAREKEKEVIGADKENVKTILTNPESQSSAPHSNSQAPLTTSTGSSHLPNVIAPPTPPVPEPSSSASGSQKQPSHLSQASAFPPGLVAPSGRPLTPVSEFDRTLDTFGDGSFAFNLSASNTASPFAKGKERLSMDDNRNGDEENGRHDSRFNPDAESTSASAQASRDGSPQRGRGAHLAALHGYPSNEDEHEDTARTSYQGPFDPFAFAGDPSSTPSKAGIAGESDSRSGSPFTSAAFANGKLEGPPGLSRVNTAASSQDGMSISSAVRGGPPPGLEEASSRHRSRFGFARPGSTERGAPASTGMGHAGGSNSGTSSSAAVSDLFKGLNGAPGLAGGLSGTVSPLRPDSAQSFGPNFAAQAPPGIFSPVALNGTASGSVGSASGPGLPLASGASMFASNPPLPPPAAGNANQEASNTSPQNQKKTLADLFPGVDLAASFSAASTLPDSLIKSLGISLDNLDLQATVAANGKLPSFAPLPLGQSAGLANLPLPPKAGSGQHSSPGDSSVSSLVPPQQALNGAATILSHGAMPPGLGTSRQAQQTHAQKAQQAHQAQLAAEQAQAQAALQHHRSTQQQPVQHSGIGHPHYGKSFADMWCQGNNRSYSKLSILIRRRNW